MDLKGFLSESLGSAVNSSLYPSVIRNYEKISPYIPRAAQALEALGMPETFEKDPSLKYGPPIGMALKGMSALSQQAQEIIDFFPHEDKTIQQTETNMSRNALGFYKQNTDINRLPDREMAGFALEVALGGKVAPSLKKIYSHVNDIRRFEQATSIAAANRKPINWAESLRNAQRQAKKPYQEVADKLKAMETTRKKYNVVEEQKKLHEKLKEVITEDRLTMPADMSGRNPDAEKAIRLLERRGLLK